MQVRGHVPPTSAHWTPTPRDGSDHAEAMSHIDGCPNCVRNTEKPRASVQVTNGYRCAYLCGDCGHAWTTDYRSDH